MAPEVLDITPCREGAQSCGAVASAHIEQIDDLRCDEWNAYVARHPNGTIFHMWGWRRAVEKSFQHRPIYLVAMREGRIAGCLPLFHVRSLFLGSMLISVPYAVGGGILADDVEPAGALFRAARDLCSELSCRCVEFRSEKASIDELAVSDRYVGFERELPGRPEEVLGWLPRKARAAARQGRERFGLAIAHGEEHLDLVWQLYAENMGRLGSPVYPKHFFEALAEATEGRHWVSRVTWDGKPVAGLVTFLHGDRVMPYFFGSTPSAKVCHAANFIYMSVMERAVEEGYRAFDFGRSRRDNAGSCDFKRFQGFTPRPLEYQTYCPPGEHAPASSPSSGRYTLARHIWRHLPLALTTALGGRLTKHFPG